MYGDACHSDQSSHGDVAQHPKDVGVLAECYLITWYPKGQCDPSRHIMLSNSGAIMIRYCVTSIP